MDGLLWVKAEAMLKHNASRLAKKRKDTYSRTCRYVKCRVAMTLVQATHHCIRRAGVPAYRISVNRPQW